MIHWTKYESEHNEWKNLLMLKNSMNLIEEFKQNTENSEADSTGQQSWSQLKSKHKMTGFHV